MAHCIEAIGAAVPLRSSDWRAFARKYNGPSYERNQYHTRLNAEHARFASGVLPDIDVRGAQLYLTYLGYQPGAIDGITGRRTRSALAEFQLQEGLPVTERLDKATMPRLRQRAGID
jgi:peptidoglycan hydrolase-like protein with peptidoglycan-binding domain